MRGSANTYNLPEHLRAKAMCSIIADIDHHRFILGSCSIPPSKASETFEQRSNEMHLLSYSEDANRIDVEKVYKLPDTHAEVT